MRDENKERYPVCVPPYYRIFLKLRKSYRQMSVRLAESAACRLANPPEDGSASGGKESRPLSEDITANGKGYWLQSQDLLSNPPSSINKSAVWLEEDMARPEFNLIAQKIETLKEKLKSKGHRFTNTAATFLPRMFYPRSERTKLWENVWTIHHSGVRSGHRVLDVGGASTPFSFYLAEMGCSVAVIDNDWGNCGTLYNADHVAKKMGWSLKTTDHDIAKRWPFPDQFFDRVFSICTIEHLTSTTRRFMMKEAGRVLKPGGIAAITMCYDPNHKVLLVDKGLRFGYRDKLEADVIRPSGLSLYGNKDLVDFRDEKGFLGALFLEKGF